MDPVDQCLRQLRRRWWLQCWLRTLVPVTIFVSVIELLCGFARIAMGLPPFSFPAVMAGLFLAPLFTTFLNSRRAWDLGTVARMADEQTRSRDRFATALDLAKISTPTAVEQLALADAREFAVTHKIRPPVENWWCLLRLAPVFVFALTLQLAYFYSLNRLEPAQEKAVTILKTPIPKLVDLAQKWREPELIKAAEQLNAAATALEDRLNRDPRRAALDGLARAEEAVRKAAGNFEELRQAAQALAEAGGSPEMQAAVQQGNYAKAAEAARQMPREPMERAIAQAASASRLPSLESLRNAPNPGEAAAKLMEQTARSQKRNREMEKLISSLQDLKLQSGDGEPGKPDQAASAEANDPTTASGKGEPTKDPGSQASAAEAMAGDGRKDGGGAGDEVSPAAAAGDSELPDRKEALANLLGNGNSLQELVLSGADDSEAKRKYQSIYQAAQSDEAAAVERENIPVRSRQTVKRYLESIRPAN